MKDALKTVQEFFPDVTNVVDAEEGIDIEVTKATTKLATVRNHKNCALAVQCKKTFNLDGAIVSRTRAFLVKGKTAVRYRLPESVTREIVSFDRNGGFEPGVYGLRPPDEGNRLGARPENRRRPNTGKGPKRGKPHVTTNIRTPLDSKFVA